MMGNKTDNIVDYDKIFRLQSRGLLFSPSAVDEYLQKISSLDDGGIGPLENISTLHIECVRRLVDDFKKHGINPYDYELAVSVLDYLEKFEGLEIMGVPHLLVIMLEKYYYFSPLSLIGELTWRDKYNKACYKIKNYNFSSRLVQILFKKYKTTEYDIFTPGSFVLMYKNDFELIDVMCSKSLASALKSVFLPIVKAQEKASIKYLREGHGNTVVFSEDERKARYQHYARERTQKYLRKLRNNEPYIDLDSIEPIEDEKESTPQF